EMEGLEYPVVRILAAEGFPNIEMTTSDTLNRTYFRDFLRTYYDIDYDNTEEEVREYLMKLPDEYKEQKIG
ncbi:19870_t:CDS:2, partial [Racocetra persica]